MRLMEISTEDARWHQFTEDRTWVRVEIDGEWYDLQRASEGGLQVRTERRLAVTPTSANTIEIMPLTRP